MPVNLEYISVTEFAEKHYLSERTVRNYKIRVCVLPVCQEVAVFAMNNGLTERTVCLKYVHSKESSSRCSSVTTTRRALNMVYEWLDQHKDDLMANWTKMEKSEPFDKINRRRVYLRLPAEAHIQQWGRAPV